MDKTLSDRRSAQVKASLKLLKSTGFILILAVVILTTSLGKSSAPMVPSDPYSDEAFQTIKDYYQIKDQLPVYKVISEENSREATHRTYTVRLGVTHFPDVVLVMKLPLSRAKALPALVLFSGFQTGAQAVKLMGTPDSAVYVGFEYPWPIDFSKNSLVWDWRRMEAIPVMMAVALAWLSEQSFINPNKLNVVAVSFGTMFYPLAQRLLNAQNIYPRTTTFGYGGVEMADVIGNELRHSLGKMELQIAKLLIQSQTWFVEPKFHISHLRGPFLVVNGEEDTVFPPSSRDLLFDKLAAPKKVVSLPGAHIQPDRPQVIHNFMQEVVQFLKENKGL